jgi:hypothetical protein
LGADGGGEVVEEPEGGGGGFVGGLGFDGPAQRCLPGRSLGTEASLNERGHVVLPYLVTNLLAQRLQVEDWYRRHPEIDDEPIVAPLIGPGLPRTGSTAVAALLGEDPQARSLRRWEAANPCPPPSGSARRAALGIFC